MRYFLIDFVLSRQYEPADGPPLDIPIQEGDKTAPNCVGTPGWKDAVQSVSHRRILSRKPGSRVLCEGLQLASVTGKLCSCLMTQEFQGFEFMER